VLFIAGGDARDDNDDDVVDGVVYELCIFYNKY